MRMTLKLFAYLGIFTVIALVVVWLFQVAFMNVFYKKTKLGELEEAEQAIAAAIDDGNERLQNVAEGTARNRNGRRWDGSPPLSPTGS